MSRYLKATRGKYAEARAQKVEDGDITEFVYAVQAQLLSIHPLDFDLDRSYRDRFA